MYTAILNEAAVSVIRQDYLAHRPQTFVGDFDLSPVDRKWLLEDKLALLVGVIADQSVPANRAWQLPMKLRDRIGTQHWSAKWFAAHEADLLMAIQAKPALHRFPATMAQNFTSLGQTIMTEADGDPDRLLTVSDFADLDRRLSGIRGVGPKKVNALALIIVLDLRQSLTGMSESQALFDVHLARILGNLLNQSVTAAMATAVCKQIDPTMPALVSPYLWRLDRQHRSLASVIDAQNLKSTI